MKIGFTLIIPLVLLLAACSKKNDANNSISIPPGGGGPTVTTFAGSGAAAGIDGTKELAAFNTPTGVAINQPGFLYVADRGNNAIRQISPQGVVVTIAGTGQAGFSNTTGSVTFDVPSGVATDAASNLIYVADQGNNSIRLITSLSTTTTFAGDANSGLVNASDTSARFSFPTGVALDAAGNVYVADNNNNCIREISPKGNVTTFAGSGVRGSADGTGTAATFYQPQALCVDNSGNVYVADAGNNEIRKITPQGVVTTIAGNGTAGLLNGQGTASEFNGPAGIAVDASGNLYVGDANNNVIREISAAGTVTTLAGTGAKGSANGIAGSATFFSPQGVAVDSYGRVFVADAGNNVIRVVTP